MKQNFTTGSVWKSIAVFSLPYFFSYFLQMLYGLADLYIIGQFHGASSITAVSVGSQLMHMITVILVGLAMGTTVLISQAVGSGATKEISGIIGNTIGLFLFTALGMAALLLLCTDDIVALLSTPTPSVPETARYLRICFAGIPFITAYNVISAIFRGMGDSRRPMYFIAVACLLNIALDYLFIGCFGLRAEGAALATVISQSCSVLTALGYLASSKGSVRLKARDFSLRRSTLRRLLQIGVPVALQDGLIQISFMVITVIVNQRGVYAAAGVGIVEKIISILFLVPSTMMSTVSALAAQNNGAGRHGRARQTLGYAIAISVCSGILFTSLCLASPKAVIGLFTEDAAIRTMGARYLQSYVFDCIIAGIHFCFSGYFCAYGKSYLSFLHNILAIVLMRIPGAYLFSLWFPEDLLPMGMAAPLGSAISSLLCIIMYARMQKSIPSENTF